MNKTVRFLLVGGFLGSGKTTAIARLARHYMGQGLQVGLVTNDQANDLVDTRSLQSQGFLVGEVSGACFCCQFNDLIDVLAELGDGRSPDVIIAEPVGSCVDLVATVIEPLRRLHADRYSVGPLVVLLKPEHGLKILRQDSNGGFSPKAAYIFMKQVEEADIVAINKVDNLTDAERDELVQLVRARFPDKPVLAISARRGDHFELLAQAMEGSAPSAQAALEIDYDTYAEGEAELGWLNCQLSVAGMEGPFCLDELVHNIVKELGVDLNSCGATVAHIKVLGQHNDATAVANQVADDVAAELSRESNASVPDANLIINARAGTTPATLESTLRESLERLFHRCQIKFEIGQFQCFQPGRPVPTHRLAGD